MKNGVSRPQTTLLHGYAGGGVGWANVGQGPFL